MNAPSRYESFLALAVQLGANRRSPADYGLYERLKADFQREFPTASPEQYEQAMQAIAKATGV